MEINWHSLSSDKVLSELNTSINGLTEDEVSLRRKKFGWNELPEEKPLTKLKIFLAQLSNPLIYILIIAGIITLFLREIANTIIIFSTVILNTFIGFFQENKASKIFTELKKAVKIKAHIIREGNEKEIEQKELVPGDIILLRTGSKVPADARLIENHNLKINESILTGEWLPAEKNTNILPENTFLADRDNMAYAGTIIEDGFAKAVVTATGIKTEIGKIAQSLRESKEEKTPYQKRIEYLSKVIGAIIVFICLSLFILGVATGQRLWEMFLIAVAVAVAAIPQGLPAAITVIFALGMQRILRKKGLIRKMIAAETLGSTTIICTDKTGTLTEAKMQVAEIYPGDDETKNLVLKIAVLCSEAFVENPDESLEKLIIRGKPTEKALIIAGAQAGLNKKELQKKYPEVDRLFFDPVYKFSASLNEISQNEELFLGILGAPEKILMKARYLKVNDQEKILTNEIRKDIERRINEFTKKGERVLATAYKKIKNQKSKIKNLEELCNDLSFAGLISLRDPLRKEAKEAMRICRRAGMRPIIVTGDHKLTAKTIAAELGIPSEEKNIITGEELEKLNEKEFQERLKEIEIYARVEPKQKLRIVSAWQKKREIVAMTGDGINDAPALKQADIGVALGSGTDVAKEASDLIILTDNFSVIVAAIEEGRAIIDNIKKTITLLISQCFSEIILISASIIGGLPLPLLPAQILWGNLIEGSPQGITLAFEPKEEGIMERNPENPQAPLLTSYMKKIIFGFGIFTNFILLILFLVFLRQQMVLAEIRTILFAALSIDTIFYTFSCKNLRKNIWQYNPFSNIYLIWTMIFSITMLFLAIYFPPLQQLLQTVPLSLNRWYILFFLGIINLVLIELLKLFYIPRMNNKTNKPK